MTQIKSAFNITKKQKYVSVMMKSEEINNSNNNDNNPRLQEDTFTKTFARIPGGSMHLYPRFKRSIQETETKELNLIFKSPFLNRHQHLKLDIIPRAQTSLISPHFKFIVRDGSKSYAKENGSLHHPELCLYRGSVREFPESSVSLSSCDEGKLNGIIHLDDKDFLFESVDPSRLKREALQHKISSPDDEIIQIHERSNSFGKCGLNKRNKKRFFALNMDAWTDNESPYSFQSRVKRQASKRKAIELAVFVDDVLYSNVQNNLDSNKDNHDEFFLTKIQNIVFTYLNSVQLLYESSRLSTKFELILVRLEVARTPIRGLIKHRNIERYLESFCGWQKSINPGGIFMGDLDTPDHWDHGLMLTGLNLYDTHPKYDNVIGLAWVSGMCHPAFSCTINEGNNFESVYVIAHEMGHSLGMNHDGELDEGNTCNPNKYLMSPILGPGKVTWSSCSNEEIEQFLNERRFVINVGSGRRRKTIGQASCLNDIPPTQEDYNYAKAQRYKYPGELYSAHEQCIQAFGKTFKPHLKESNPFEDICRELWCSNRTHALRAHPALEGTNCHLKPFPFGSVCKDGLCQPFDPSGRKNRFEKTGSILNDVDESLIDGRPSWFDPIFTDIFHELKTRYSKIHKSKEGEDSQ
nr:A disintegrin and metalloproteinase with thrombospondin motifs adt-1-like [Lepeophtheirus salmonis]